MADELQPRRDQVRKTNKPQPSKVARPRASDTRTMSSHMLKRLDPNRPIRGSDQTRASTPPRQISDGSQRVSAAVRTEPDLISCFHTNSRYLLLQLSRNFRQLESAVPPAPPSHFHRHFRTRCSRFFPLHQHLPLLPLLRRVV